MINKILIMLMFFSVLISCIKTQKQESIDDYMNNKYIKSINESGIPKFMFSYFPESVSNLLLSLDGSYDVEKRRISYLMYIHLNNKIELDSIISLCQKNAINEYKASERSVPIVTIVNEDTILKNQESNFSVSKQYPIPYFEPEDNIAYSEVQLIKSDVFSTETLSGLSQDFTIYVLDAKSGDYWEGLKPLDYMPEGWKNGYSRGICINEKKGIVIYWVIIW